MVVEDNGPGLDPDVAGELLEPFKKARDSSGGAGLGTCDRQAGRRVASRQDRDRALPQRRRQVHPPAFRRAIGPCPRTDRPTLSSCANMRECAKRIGRAASCLTIASACARIGWRRRTDDHDAGKPRCEELFQSYQRRVELVDRRVHNLRPSRFEPEHCRPGRCWTSQARQVWGDGAPMRGDSCAESRLRPASSLSAPGAGGLSAAPILAASILTGCAVGPDFRAAGAAAGRGIPPGCGCQRARARQGVPLWRRHSEPLVGAVPLARPQRADRAGRSRTTRTCRPPRPPCASRRPTRWRSAARCFRRSRRIGTPRARRCRSRRSTRRRPTTRRSSACIPRR